MSLLSGEDGAPSLSNQLVQDHQQRVAAVEADAVDEVEGTARAWLDAFSTSLTAVDAVQLRSLFVDDAWWRDVLAFGWDLRTVHGATAVVQRLVTTQGVVQATDFAVRAGASRLDMTPRGPVAVAFVDFRTATGTCQAVLRLVDDGTGAWRAWILTTAMHGLHDFPEHTGDRRPSGIDHGGQPGRMPYALRRAMERESRNADPDVLIIGAGQAGLCLAARLAQLDVRALILERNGRIGDNWRLRYPSLTLHDPVYANHLPYLPFPETWPLFSPKDKIGDWLESYAVALDLNVWTGALVTGSRYDPAQGWSVEVEHAGETRSLRAKHLVLAIGLAGEPRIPDFAGAEVFQGSIVHSGRYGGGAPWKGCNAVVIGAGTSAHDVAQDLWEQGAHVTMVQRSSTMVLSSRSYVRMLERLYHSGARPLEEADLDGISIPHGLMALFQKPLTAHNADADREILEALVARGFKIDFGPDDIGVLAKHLTGKDGYYIDVGASRLVANGDIALKQGVEIRCFDPGGVSFVDGSYLPADLVVLATGYDSMREAARRVVGDEVDRCHANLYRLDAEGEQIGVWRPSGHPALWFMVGSFQRSRYYSRVLALQLKAQLTGLASPAAPVETNR